MRIVHTSLRYPPAAGGAEKYTADIVEYTRSQSTYDVRVVTSKMKTHGPPTELAPDSLLDDPVYVQRLHYKQTPGISYPRLQALQYYLHHHKPQVIHGYSFWYHPADGAAFYSRRHKIPFIFHPIYYENHIRRKPLWKIYAKTIGKRTFASADAVAVISPYEQHLIEEAGYPVKRFIHIPPALRLEEFDIPLADPFYKRNIFGSIVLAVSRISKSKDLSSAIKSFPAIKKEVPDAQLVIIGEDFGEKEALDALVRSLNATSYVHFLGSLSRSELVASYQHATLLLHPSTYEAFGIVLAESLAAGTPVVGRNATAIPYVAPHSVGSLLFNSESELTANTITLLKNNKLRDELGRKGRAHVAAQFDRSVVYKKLVQLYDELYQDIR